ncbi:Acetylornithine aminotransferase, mitochondrial [Hondaea fermentalgiana]|uniref:Acetylornithine aminotransferase, mitochondrial n=1 Tax=Hondaea fermentalgiana TaxID=2315210 RepID=A0A2R5GXW7_9STRA|nr:Acetylornithine aminotransferase, mitochondrial [Hondaea fermentalgiana]|eukprot:GBG32814.1 Acetylornithine aminotransferase, mitochondrial [Hondaea fermentalgiana]
MAHVSAKRAINRGVGRLADLVVTEAKGCWVATEEGRKLLDMASGIGVVSTGHCHPRVVAAAQEQVGRVIHAQVNIAYHDKMLELTDVLQPLMPKGLDSVFYTNSGAEAVENAVKIARNATGKGGVIVMQGSYHGRTLGTAAMTTSGRGYRQKFGPFMPSVYVTPFPYEHQGTSTAKAIAEFDLLFKQQVHPDDIAAVVMEPVLGEGGYVPATREYVEHVQAFCKANDILLVMDEVQTGFGRTGKLFATEHFDVVPDILVTAKGIASGFPLAAVWSRQDITDKQDPGTMGGTYTANAVACAAAIATQQVIKDENLVQNSHDRGAQLMDALRGIQKDRPDIVSDVRGLGCMVGVEFNTKLSGIKGAVSKACLDRDMILLGCSAFETVRFIPPLTVSADEIDRAVEIFTEAVDEAASSASS